MSLKIEAEIKVESEPCVLTWGNKLFVGAEDGSIKAFDEKLVAKESWAAHAVQPFALATDGAVLYSSSNDGAIKVWSMTGDKIAELPSTGADVGSLYVYDKQLYAGDEDGNITVYENNALKAKYNVLEEVKDLTFSPPFLFTVRDLYVTATEIKPEESKTRFTTRHTMEGRAPLRIAGNRLVFMSRDGNSLKLHDGSIDNNFKQLHEIKVSDMIVISLSTSGDYVWTAGWDGFVRRWKIAGDKLEPFGEINLGGCVNSVVATGDSVYAAVTGGKIVHLR
uniref:Anaphase-promoting complex subunit 4 WD40 domain-containing protein n=1 Tax=Heliothis virescens TaxID=7102 RepID=A0A2A4JVX5_HELVI